MFYIENKSNDSEKKTHNCQFIFRLSFAYIEINKLDSFLQERAKDYNGLYFFGFRL